MTYIMIKKRIPLLLASLTLLFAACDPGEQDYRYVITNKTTLSDSIIVTYNIEGENDELSTKLESGDSIVIAERNDIEGKGIWNIETSVSLYKVPHLRATDSSGAKISEELAYRKYWKGPSDIDGEGVYQLDIEDCHFQLTLQEDYTYCIKNELNDTIFSTSHLKMLSGENTTRSADTILTGESKSIGSVDIYTYDDSIRNEGKYKVQKLTGISSLFFLYKGNRIEMKIDKDTAYFQAEPDTCFLIVNDEMSKIQNIKK